MATTKIKEKIEILKENRETLVKQLQEVIKNYETGKANLNAIDGAIMGLEETLAEITAEETPKKESDEVSKH